MTITHINSNDKINDVVDKVNEVIDATNTIQGPFVSGVVQQSVDAAAEVIDQGVEDINDIKDATISESNVIKAQTEVARNQAEAARDAALLSRGLWQTTAQGIGQGVAGIASLVAGSGGTNGTFDLAFSGGTQVIAPKGYFVVAGGAVTQVVITYAGHYSAGTPTLSFAASAGLSGASATAVMGANTQVGQYFSVPVSGSDDSLILYKVTTGPIATEITRYPSSVFAASVGANTARIDNLYAINFKDAYFYNLNVSEASGGTVTGGRTFVMSGVPHAGDDVTFHKVALKIDTATSSTFRFKVLNVVGGGVFNTAAQSELFVVTSATTEVTLATPLTLSAGQVLGVYTSVNSLKTIPASPGTSYYQAPSVDTAVGVDVAFTGPTASSFVFAVDPIFYTPAENTETVARITNLSEDVGYVPEKLFGEDLPALGLPASSSNWVINEANPSDRVVSRFTIYSLQATTAKIRAYSKAGTTYTVLREFAFPVVVGLNTVYPDMALNAGEYFGTYFNGLGIVSFSSDQSKQNYYTIDTHSAATVGSTGEAISYSNYSVMYRVDYAIPRPQDNARRIAALEATSEISKAVPFNFNMICGVGQSNMYGNTVGSVTTAQEYDTLGFTAGSASTDMFNATAATTGYGSREWSGLGCAKHLKDLIAKRLNVPQGVGGNTFVIDNEGQGNAKISEINKGTTKYNNHITKATALASKTGDTNSGVIAVIYMQGETDGGLYPDQSNFIADLKELAEDYSTDLRAATGQVLDVPLFTYQQGRYRNNSLALLKASQESGLIHMVAPIYQLGYVDNVHITAEAQRIMGAYFAEAIYSVQVAKKSFEALHCVDSRIDGSTITLTFNKYGLVLDSTLLPLQKNSGFEVFNGVTEQTVSSVSVINSNQVRITLSAPASSGMVVKYGTYQVGLSPYNGFAGNLRDSNGQGNTFDGVPLHNWCVLFDWTI